MNEHQQTIYNTLEEMHILVAERLLREGVERNELSEEDREIVLRELKK